MSQADDYRQRAAEAQRQADAATSKSVRQTFLDVAKKYLALAANEERSATLSARLASRQGAPPSDARS